MTTPPNISTEEGAAPRPWKVEGNFHGWGPSWSGCYRLRGDINNHQPTKEDTARLDANAALICEAVNSHEYLKARVAALEGALEEIVKIRNGEHADGALGKITDAWKVARAVLESGPCRHDESLTPAPSMGKEV
jgi:hypothetical protein